MRQGELGISYHAIVVSRAIKKLGRSPDLPGWLKRLMIVGLIVKASPFDFGLDELILGVVVLVVWIRYPHVWRACWTMARDELVWESYDVDTSAEAGLL